MMDKPKPCPGPLPGEKCPDNRWVTSKRTDRCRRCRTDRQRERVRMRYYELRGRQLEKRKGPEQIAHIPDVAPPIEMTKILDFAQRMAT